jgi:hypothetical protein
VAGRNVHTVSLPAKAATSSSVRYVQWSADAHPSATASCTPGPGPSWLACRRPPSPRACPASITARHWSASNAPTSQNASIQRACGAQASSIDPQTTST